MTSMSSVGPASPYPYMLSAARADGGGTFDPRTGRRVAVAGYVVGGISPVLTVPLADVDANLAAARTVATTTTAPYVGAWIDDGLVYWEGSESFDSLPVAVAVAAARGEQAIYDATARESIYVPSSGQIG